MTQRFRTQSKTIIILVLGTLIAIGPFSIDMYLPAFGDIADDFGVDISKIGLTLTSYFIGIALGQLAYGPLMDRYGRRRPLIIGLLLFIIAAIACSLSTNLNMLIVSRFFMALGGCAGMVASKAIVRDLFEKKQVADVLSTLMLIMGIAPIIAPTVGGLVVANFHWEVVFYMLAVFAVIMLLNVTFILPESSKPNFETSLAPKAVAKEYASIMVNREFFIFAMTRSFAMASLLTYVSSAPFIFIEHFGLSEAHFGWVFGGNAFGLILGSQINRLFIKKYSLMQVTKVVTILLTILTGIGLLTNLFVDSFWAVYPVLFSMLFLIGFQNPNTTALALDPFTKQGGSASALIGSLGMAFGSLASILISVFLKHSLLPLFIIVFACSVLSLFLITYQNRKERSVSYETANA